MVFLTRVAFSIFASATVWAQENTSFISAGCEQAVGGLPPFSENLDRSNQDSALPSN